MLCHAATCPPRRMSVLSDRSCASSTMIALYLRSRKSPCSSLRRGIVVGWYCQGLSGTASYSQTVAGARGGREPQPWEARLWPGWAPSQRTVGEGQQGMSRKQPTASLNTTIPNAIPAYNTPHAASPAGHLPSHARPNTETAKCTHLSRMPSVMNLMAVSSPTRLSYRTCGAP